jgi:hypothetical protein
MQPTRPDFALTQRQGRTVEVRTGSEGMLRVTLSVPSGRGRSAAERRKVLERARQMLASALDEERAKAPTPAASGQKSGHPAPGCGAWWTF